MIGGEAVPYGRVWRTGANEPTMIHTTGHLVIAGIHVDAGTYALYTVPGEREWEVIVNRSHRQWGHESTYTDSVRVQEVGRGRVPTQRVERRSSSSRSAPSRTGTGMPPWCSSGSTHGWRSRCSGCGDGERAIGE